MSHILAVLASTLRIVFAVNCVNDAKNWHGVPLDDTVVWDVRAQICNNSACDKGQICTKTVDNNDDTPKIAISYYSQTGSFDECWDAIGNIISQCNRNGYMAGAWDYDGQIYRAVNNIDTNGDLLASSASNSRTDARKWLDQKWVLSAGSRTGDWKCTSGHIKGCSTGAESNVGGCSQSYTGTKTTTSSFSVGGQASGTVDAKSEKGFLGAIEKFAAGLVGLARYEWGTQSTEGTSFTYNPNKDYYTVLA